ncbi:hypothetical protein C1701_07910 [Actinoalloteichus sp. AHMU CJ021]|uniref:MSCRAMM family protein n=1 Tax=Actinoalloteichus sp. AHMU CJ021 TaxID=2072503 RepID=UPI000CA001DD|nr:hypothetical protein C1701_07910 [Actinoalloteichus sp. AHMU CJ021]
MLRRVAAGLASASLLAGAALVALPGTAAAAVQEGLGHRTAPQPYQGKPNDYDWVGSYVWQGEQVWCVQYSYRAPDTEEEYVDGDQLLTKWGDPLSPEISSNISYLLLRYSGTESDHEASALAHLLHSWTAAPRTPADLDPSNGFREIAYDVEFHFDELPPETQEAVEAMKADAEVNRGPWEVSLTAPEGEQVIGQPDSWRVDLLNTAGNGVPDIPVEVTLTDAELADPEVAEPARQILMQDLSVNDELAADLAAEEATEAAAEGVPADGAADQQTQPLSTTTPQPTAPVETPEGEDGAEEDDSGEPEPQVRYLRTPEDGGPLLFDVVPTGENPSVHVSVQTPADQPRIKVPQDGSDVQRIVTTGGEDTVTAEAAVTARTAPGAVEIAKVDASTGLPVADVQLRITSADKSSPALRQDDSELVGPDGEPLVVTTDEEGYARLEDLRTPQEICVVEVGVPAGYEEEFDPANPPTACGLVEAGDTLTLTIANKPNPPTVPSTIPAGEADLVTASSETVNRISPVTLTSLGLLVLLAAGATGLVWRRRMTSGDQR